MQPSRRVTACRCLFYQIPSDSTVLPFRASPRSLNLATHCRIELTAWETMENYSQNTHKILILVSLHTVGPLFHNYTSFITVSVFAIKSGATMSQRKAVSGCPMFISPCSRLLSCGCGIMFTWRCMSFLGCKLEIEQTGVCCTNISQRQSCSGGRNHLFSLALEQHHSKILSMLRDQHSCLGSTKLCVSYLPSLPTQVGNFVTSHLLALIMMQTIRFCGDATIADAVVLMSHVL